MLQLRVCDISEGDGEGSRVVTVEILGAGKVNLDNPLRVVITDAGTPHKNRDLAFASIRRFAEDLLQAATRPSQS
jgi:hypothetical protein